MNNNEIINRLKNDGFECYTQKLIDNNFDCEVFDFCNYENNFDLNWSDVNQTFYFDDNNNCGFLIFEGKRLYFNSYNNDFNNLNDGWFKCYHVITNEKILSYHSPHSYISSESDIDDCQILVDVGAQEAVFALKWIDKFEHIYIVECDSDWIRPLELTFAPWKDKVTIVNKFVSNFTGENNCDLNDIVSDEHKKKNIFVKADIEGYEIAMVSGSYSFFKDYNVKFGICTYHRQSDYNILKSVFESLGYDITHSENMMYMRPESFQWMNIKSEYPYFRYGVIRGNNFKKL